MSLKSWIDAAFSGLKRGARRRTPLRRPPLMVEQLENRLTPSLASVFEVDGDTTTTVSHDWDQVFADAGSPSGSASFVNGTSSAAIAGSFITDKVNSGADDIFKGNGSQDTMGIQQGPWQFTNAKPQGKNDIAHAYAAAYSDPSNGHLLLYAGLDRFDNGGDSFAEFWFFKNVISENPNVTANGGHPFNGTHTDGDILLVSDFTVGGSTSALEVFRWTGTDSTGSLVALNGGNPISGSTLAVVNGTSISVPWAFTDKSGATLPAAGEFIEEGVDLSALGLQGGFACFLAKLGSSLSSANHSDFAIGSFSLAGSAAAPTAFSAATPLHGISAADSVISNTGFPSLNLPEIGNTNMLESSAGTGSFVTQPAQSTDLSPSNAALTRPTLTPNTLDVVSDSLTTMSDDLTYWTRPTGEVWSPTKSPWTAPA